MKKHLLLGLLILVTINGLFALIHISSDTINENLIALTAADDGTLVRYVENDSGTPAAPEPTQKPGVSNNAFGTNGIQTISINGAGAGFFILTLPDNNFVIAGTAGAPGFSAYISPDGRTTYKTNSDASDLTDVFGLTRSNDTVYVHGTDGSTAVTWAYDFSGNIISSFGSSGKKTIAGISSPGNGNIIAYHANGLFIVINNSSQFSLHKLDATGTFISDFNSGSAIDLDAAGFVSVDAIVGYGDHIYVYGADASQTSIRKYNATTGAQITTGFGTSGVASVGTDTPKAMAIDLPTGLIYAIEGDGSDALLYRIGTDGILDTSFGTSGKITFTGFGDPQSVVVGHSDTQYVLGDIDSVGHVERITGGAIDTSFGAAGIITNASATQLESGIITADGNLVVVGDNGSVAVLWKITGGVEGESVQSKIARNAFYGGSGVVG